jgi:hypothetical protein
MTEDQWNEYLKRSKTWSIRVGFDLLHSTAYKKLKYGPAIKVLNCFYEKVRYQVDKKKRGKYRYRLIDGGEIIFTYEEGEFRGLNSSKFSRALRELHHFGFIDVKRPGSGLKGDHTIFVLSQRWKNFGTANFEFKEWPKSVYSGNFGYRGKCYRTIKIKKKVSDENSSFPNDEFSSLKTCHNDENLSLKTDKFAKFQR